MCRQHENIWCVRWGWAELWCCHRPGGLRTSVSLSVSSWGLHFGCLMWMVINTRTELVDAQPRNLGHRWIECCLSKSDPWRSCASTARMTMLISSHLRICMIQKRGLTRLTSDHKRRIPGDTLCLMRFEGYNSWISYAVFRERMKSTMKMVFMSPREAHRHGPHLRIHGNFSYGFLIYS